MLSGRPSAVSMKVWKRYRFLSWDDHCLQNKSFNYNLSLFKGRVDLDSLLKGHSPLWRIEYVAPGHVSTVRKQGGEGYKI